MPNEPILLSDVLGGTTRRTERAVSRVQSASVIRQTSVDSEADVSSAKLDAITNITGQALGAVARVSQAEMTLAQNVPTASGRLALIADQFTLAASEVVADLNSRVRRK